MNTPTTLIDELVAYLDDAEALLARGEYTALGGLDDAVAELCRRIEGMRVDEAQHYLPHLEQLMGRLDTLQEKMGAARDTIRGEIDASTVRQKAARAYRKDPK